MSKEYLMPVLRLLDKYRALTQGQLAEQCDVPLSTMSRFLMTLKNSEYVRVIDSFKPFIYTLGPAGARQLEVKPPRYDSSVRALQHICHRNEALFDLQGKSAERVRLIAKSKLYQFGLNPAASVEHGLVVGQELQLLMVDDGGMDRRRLRTAWEREHKPHKTFNAGELRAQGRKVILRWREACPKMVIYTREVASSQKYCARFNIPADVHPLNSLWEMGE